MNNKFHISENSTYLINELINEGWEFMLHYGDHETYCDRPNSYWEANFTRQKNDGKWDNHRCGYGENADIAIKEAYDNIRNGLRLTKIINFYSAETSDKKIIAYGDVNGRRRYKIEYKKNTYVSYKLINGKYKMIEKCVSLDDAISLLKKLYE